MLTETIKALILAIIQGLTEWFPISSSGHLALFQKILSYEATLQFDVALHFGTLMAVFVYFGKDITDILKDFLSGKWKTQNGRMAWYLIIASMPAALLGYFLRNVFENIKSLEVIALGFAVTGLLLIITSKTQTKKKDEKNNWKKSLSIGFSQALAIIPGISRSGSTISTGILLGLKEKNAMKFAFLMAIPIIFGANILTIGNNTLEPNLLWATLTSFAVGLASIHVVFKHVLVKRKNLLWFGIYCLLLAAGIGTWIVLQ